MWISESDDGFARWVSCGKCEADGPVNPKGNAKNSHQDVADAWNARRSDGLRNWLKAEMAKFPDDYGVVNQAKRDAYRLMQKQAEKLLDRPV